MLILLLVVAVVAVDVGGVVDVVYCSCGPVVGVGAGGGDDNVVFRCCFFC